MKVAIIGTGYVGLPTGAGLAKFGHDVTCIDCDREKVEKLRAGKVTLFEEGLEELLKSGLESGRLTFTEDVAQGVKGAQIVMVAVGTPENPDTGEANLTYLFAAVKQLAQCLEHPTVVAVKSTVPVGTGDEVEKLIRETNLGAQAEVISLPEFLREGYAVHDFFHPVRIVVGTQSQKARELIRELYAPLPNATKFLFVARRSSEAIKYASNAFLAVKIHYINEMADFCEAAGANIHEVAQGMGLDSRIGPAFLKPGPGYGGSCFPKDTKAIEYMARKLGVELSLIRTAIKGNMKRRENMAQRVLKEVEDIPSPKIAVWGLAFKEGTDDCRESPAVEIVQRLASHHVDICVYDPQAMTTARRILGDTVRYASDMYSAAQGADVLVILTEWPQFDAADWKRVASELRSRHILDFRFFKKR